MVEELRAARGRPVPAPFVTGIGEAQPLAENAAIGGLLAAKPFNLRQLRRTIASLPGA